MTDSVFVSFEGYADSIRKINKIARLGHECDQRIGELVKRAAGPTIGDIAEPTSGAPPVIEVPSAPAVEQIGPFWSVRLVTRNAPFLMHGFHQHDGIVVGLGGRFLDVFIYRSIDLKLLHRRVRVPAASVIECSPVLEGAMPECTRAEEFDDNIPF